MQNHGRVLYMTAVHLHTGMQGNADLCCEMIAVLGKVRVCERQMLK